MTIKALTTRLLFVCAVFGFLAVGMLRPAHTDDATYVGSAACKDCHEDEYANFYKYSKKVHSGKAILTMATDLTQDELKECFHCHTTGYGEPGGFESFDKTPDLANAGCEVCHGPGSRHVDEFGDTQYIKGKLTIKDCERCHNPERVAAFDYKPLIFGGAH